MLQINRPDSLSKIAEEHIRQGIVNGRFQLGESLQEAKLSKALGVSKTPIREALAALNLQGLVRIIPQRGAFVFSLSREDVLQLCRYRFILESSALEQAIEANHTGLLDALSTTVSKMSEAQQSGESERYLELDAEFHHAFFEHCGNSYLRDGYQRVGDIVRTMRTHLSARPDRTEKSFREHESILLLLREENATAAKEILRRQITRGERSYSDLVSVNQTK